MYLKNLIGILVVCAFVQEAQSQITSNVFRRVLLIETAPNSFGTSFTIDVDGRQYLITAKHVVAKVPDDGAIRIYRDDKWVSTHVKILRAQDPIDIAVLIPPEQITVSFPLEPTLDGMRYGQDVFFAGFPYGENLFSSARMGDLYPIPFVKKGIISAEGNEKGARVLYVDGHNNQGFSGGPIVFRDLGQQRFVYKVAGVISGFRPDFGDVFVPEKIARKDIKPEDHSRGRIIETKDGDIYRLRETGNLVQTNSGIVIGYSIVHALELIKKNPAGPKVSK